VHDLPLICFENFLFLEYYVKHFCYFLIGEIGYTIIDRNHSILYHVSGVGRIFIQTFGYQKLHQHSIKGYGVKGRTDRHKPLNKMLDMHKRVKMYPVQKADKMILIPESASFYSVSFSKVSDELIPYLLHIIRIFVIDLTEYGHVLKLCLGIVEAVRAILIQGIVPPSFEQALTDSHAAIEFMIVLDVFGSPFDREVPYFWFLTLQFYPSLTTDKEFGIVYLTGIPYIVYFYDTYYMILY